MGARIDFGSRLSISLSPMTWLINSIAVGASKITSNEEKIIVLNDGNVAESYSLQVIDVAGTWSASTTVGGSDVNRYVLSGIFTALDILEVDDSDFNELGNEDLVLEGVSQLSSDTKFATTLSTKNGAGVIPNEERILWLKFDAPKADTTQEQHDIRVFINAELSK